MEKRKKEKPAGQKKKEMKEEKKDTTQKKVEDEIKNNDIKPSKLKIILSHFFNITTGINVSSTQMLVVSMIK